MLSDWGGDERMSLIWGAVIVTIIATVSISIAVGINVNNYLEFEQGVITDYCRVCKEYHVFFAHCRECGKKIEPEDHEEQK